MVVVRVGAAVRVGVVAVGAAGAGELDDEGGHGHFDVELGGVDEGVEEDEDFGVGEGH